MIVEVPEPKTASGRWQRKQATEMAAITGQRYCSSCRAYHPVADMRMYPTMRGKAGIWRCNACQSRRKAFVKEK